jgi:hypothetical protein
MRTNGAVCSTPVPGWTVVTVTAPLAWLPGETPRMAMGPATAVVTRAFSRVCRARRPTVRGGSRCAGRVGVMVAEAGQCGVRHRYVHPARTEAAVDPGEEDLADGPLAPGMWPNMHQMAQRVNVGAM